METAMPKRGREASFKQREQIEAVSVTPSLERQQWLERAVEAMRNRFIGAGYTVPQKIRVSIGWPKRAASCGAIGECWSTDASSDRHAELFVSPELTEGGRILDVLAHELVHATVGTAAGHKKPFKQCALKIGLQGPMRATTDRALSGGLSHRHAETGDADAQVRMRDLWLYRPHHAQMAHARGAADLPDRSRPLDRGGAAMTITTLALAVIIPTTVVLAIALDVMCGSGAD
jgi:hypothetical protein